MMELNSPQRVKKIVLEDGTEIDINSKPLYANIDRWQIIITIPIRPEDWEKFFKDYITLGGSK